MPVAVAIYVGPLSARRSRRFGIREQVRRCWNYSDNQGWKVASIFVDVAENRSLAERTNFRDMLEEARTGKCAVLVFYRLEYLCNSRMDFIAAEKSIKKSRVNFHDAIKIGGHALGCSCPQN
jgi:DNA invertase Pin-like site-specific DNA recombinase